MKGRFLQRRNIVFPTLLGWVILLAVGGVPILLWWFAGEAFFSVEERLPAEVLVVEAWTGAAGADAAALEFNRPGATYRYIVAAGGLTGEPWDQRRWSNAQIAEIELGCCGIPLDRIVAASTVETGAQRTYQTALAAKQALELRGIEPKAINVFTRGSHARRSRLVFAKVFEPASRVGVISWRPPGFDAGPWWRSSVRAEDMIKETVGYLYEVVLNSGRGIHQRPTGPHNGISFSPKAPAT